MDQREQEQEEAGETERLFCPKCGSLDVRRSKGEGLWASLMRSLGRWPFRCRSCRGRFFRSDPPTGRD